MGRFKLFPIFFLFLFLSSCDKDRIKNACLTLPTYSGEELKESAREITYLQSKHIDQHMIDKMLDDFLKLRNETRALCNDPDNGIEDNKNPHGINVDL